MTNLYPLLDDDQRLLSGITAIYGRRKGGWRYTDATSVIHLEGSGMGGTWREGHFDTGFGFKK
jgi:hypothetical protein